MKTVENRSKSLINYTLVCYKSRESLDPNLEHKFVCLLFQADKGLSLLPTRRLRTCLVTASQVDCGAEC